MDGIIYEGATNLQENEYVDEEDLEDIRREIAELNIHSLYVCWHKGYLC
jgi:hypothetical protein